MCSSISLKACEPLNIRSQVKSAFVVVLNLCTSMVLLSTTYVLFFPIYKNFNFRSDIQLKLMPMIMPCVPSGEEKARPNMQIRHIPHKARVGRKITKRKTQHRRKSCSVSKHQIQQL